MKQYDDWLLSPPLGHLIDFAALSFYPKLAQMAKLVRPLK